MSATPVRACADLALAGDLVTYAARLVRTMRRDHALPGGVRVLSLLDELGPSTVTALSVLDGCAQPTMSASVGRLADQGLVEKQPHPDDARSSVVDLTPAGRAELDAVRRTNAADVLARLGSHPDRSHGRTTAELATAVAVLRDVLTAPSPHPTPGPERTP